MAIKKQGLLRCEAAVFQTGQIRVCFASGATWLDNTSTDAELHASEAPGSPRLVATAAAGVYNDASNTMAISVTASYNQTFTLSGNGQFLLVGGRATGALAISGISGANCVLASATDWQAGDKLYTSTGQETTISSISSTALTVVNGAALVGATSVSNGQGEIIQAQRADPFLFVANTPQNVTINVTLAGL